MIDFGNCKKYVDEKDAHLSLDEEKTPFRSAIKFKSIHAHIGKSKSKNNLVLSRRDDL